MKKSHITPILIIATVISGILFLEKFNINQFEKENTKEESTEENEPDNLYETKQWQEISKRLSNAKPGEVIYTYDDGLKRVEEIYPNTYKEKSLEGYSTKEITLLLNTVEFKEKAHESTIWAFYNGIPREHPECQLLSTSVFESKRVSYEGNGIFIVKIIVTFECNKSYTNRTLFKVRAIYNKNSNTWSHQVLKQILL